MVFLTFKIYPESHNHILIVMIFRYFSFDVDPITIFKVMS